MTRLYLVRHGETDWNRERRIQGHQDPPLNPTGLSQASDLAERLAVVSFDAAYSSDLKRAAETARVLVGARPIAPVLRTGLRECHLGRWEGQRFDDLDTADADNGWRNRGKWSRDASPHGGETDEQFERRITAALDEIVDAHPNQTVLVVTHGGSMRVALMRWVGAPAPSMPNCVTYVVDADETKRSLIEVIE